MQKMNLNPNLEVSIPSTSSVVAGEEIAQTMVNKIAPEGKLDVYELKMGLMDASERLSERGIKKIEQNDSLKIKTDH